jgi:hypothetical protein
MDLHSFSKLEPDPHSHEKLNPDPLKVNADSKHLLPIPEFLCFYLASYLRKGQS